jgi:hypothetical protein
VPGRRKEHDGAASSSLALDRLGILPPVLQTRCAGLSCALARCCLALPPPHAEATHSKHNSHPQTWPRRAATRARPSSAPLLPCASPSRAATAPPVESFCPPRRLRRAPRRRTRAASRRRRRRRCRPHCLRAACCRWRWRRRDLRATWALSCLRAETCWTRRAGREPQGKEKASRVQQVEQRQAPEAVRPCVPTPSLAREIPPRDAASERRAISPHQARPHVMRWGGGGAGAGCRCLVRCGGVSAAPPRHADAPRVSRGLPCLR